jgi:hypothetical protein
VGVERAFARLTSNLASPCSHFYESIQDGIERGFANRLASGTSAPCHDFYETVRDGIRDATKRKETKPICTRLGGSEFRIDFGQMADPPSPA